MQKDNVYNLPTSSLWWCQIITNIKLRILTLIQPTSLPQFLGFIPPCTQMHLAVQIPPREYLCTYHVRILCNFSSIPPSDLCDDMGLTSPHCSWQWSLDRTLPNSISTMLSWKDHHMNETKHMMYPWWLVILMQHNSLWFICVGPGIQGPFSFLLSRLPWHGWNSECLTIHLGTSRQHQHLDYWNKNKTFHEPFVWEYSFWVVL
jgi:hypothetical protein